LYLPIFVAAGLLYPLALGVFPVLSPRMEPVPAASAAAELVCRCIGRALRAPSRSATGGQQEPFGRVAGADISHCIAE
jgi:hypothetical protein